MPGAKPLSLALACGVWAGAAAWLSLGTIGFVSSAGSRTGVLPVSRGALAVVLATTVVATAVVRRGVSPAPLSLLLLVVLPWLPMWAGGPFLIWSGPITGVVWVGVALALGSDLYSLMGQRSSGNGDLTPPWASAACAGLLALVIFAAAAWRTAPTLPLGDEPHYLVIVQSLLLDGDLRIDNNHRRGDYYAYYNGELAPHVQRRGRHGEVYSVHSPGLPAIVLPAFAIGGYRGVVAFLVLISAAGSALAWWVAWLATRRVNAAWFGWAAVTFPVTTVFHTFAVYPDGVGGVLTLTGMWALLRAEDLRSERRFFDSTPGADLAKPSDRALPWFWHGAALAVLPWLHSRFAVIAGGFGALIVLRLSTIRNPVPKAVAFLVVPALSAPLWLGFFIVLYGTPDPSAPYGTGQIGSLAWVPGGLAGLLFDQRFGLLPYAPVLAFAFAALGVMLAAPGFRRLALESLFVIVPYLITSTQFAMWWGGASAPARFFVPVLPLLCVPAAVFWARVERRERILALAALVVTMVVTATVVVVDHGWLAFNARDTPAPWLQWMSAASNLPQAAPSWAREAVVPFCRDVGIWIAIPLAVLVIARRATNKRSITVPAQRAIIGWSLAIGLMIASASVWAIRGVDGRNVTSAQLALLRAIGSGRPAVAMDLEHLRSVNVSSLPRRVRIELTRELPSGRGAGRDATLFELSRVPAGTYRLTPSADARGWLMIGIGRDPFAVHTAPSQPIELRFPVAVRAIVVRGDEDARQTVRSLVIEPVAVSSLQAGPVARTAVKYGRATVFFLDDRSFPEPETFWIGGARSSSIAIQPEDGATVVSLLMRNGPVANHVRLDAGGERSEADFAPGEERRFSLPVDRSRGAAFVTVDVAAGFRPSEHDTASRDPRFLGVLVRIG